METSQMRKQKPVSALFDPKIVMPAIGSAFVKLDPRTLIRNPVMFVLEIVGVDYDHFDPDLHGRAPPPSNFKS